jgi:hypothetical protein
MKNFVVSVGIAFTTISAVACSSDSTPTQQTEAGSGGSGGGETSSSGGKGGTAATGGAGKSSGGGGGMSAGGKASGGSAGSTGGNAGNAAGSTGNSGGNAGKSSGGSAGKSSGGAMGIADSGADATADGSADTDASNEAHPDGAVASAGSWIDGTWQITNITCNGAEGNAQVKGFYTAPSSFTETFAGHDMQIVFSTKNGGNTCELTCPYTFTLSGDQVSSTPSGPCTCSPANCLAGSCGTTPAAGPYPGTVMHNGSNFTFTTPANTPDTVCTSAGLSNPIVFTGVLKH